MIGRRHLRLGVRPRWLGCPLVRFSIATGRRPRLLPIRKQAIDHEQEAGGADREKPKDEYTQHCQRVGDDQPDDRQCRHHEQRADDQARHVPLSSSRQPVKKPLLAVGGCLPIPLVLSPKIVVDRATAVDDGGEISGELRQLSRRRPVAGRL